MWLLEQLQAKKYKHGGYTVFYVTEPKVRRIEKSRYIDRIVHRWLVDNFLEPAFVPQFIKKVIYLRIQDLQKKWSKGISNWKQVQNELTIIFEERYYKYIEKK